MLQSVFDFAGVSMVLSSLASSLKHQNGATLGNFVHLLRLELRLIACIHQSPRRKIPGNLSLLDTRFDHL
jgi:hypothetical protein